MITPLEERVYQWCHQGVEYEENYVCQLSVFLEIRVKYNCLFNQGFGPLVKVMEYEDKWCLGILARTHETHGEVVEGQQYNHTSSSTSPSLLVLHVNQGLGS